MAAFLEYVARLALTAGLTDRGFTGHRENRDVTLVYMNARFYSAVNRFVSADTLVPDPKYPQSFNRYTYVLSNPLKYSDPSGHCPAPTDTNGYTGDNPVICVALFIPTAESEAPGPNFIGDDRLFSDDSGQTESRMWIWIDTVTGDIVNPASYGGENGYFHETCNNWGSCAGPHDDRNQPKPGASS